MSNPIDIKTAKIYEPLKFELVFRVWDPYVRLDQF